VIDASEITAGQRSRIGPLTWDGGHHTVYQHATFEFSLSGVSRQLVWCFLHAFPFYNTEQQSQRYVRLDEVRAVVPPELGGEARRLYEAAVERAWSAYAELARLSRSPSGPVAVAAARAPVPAFGGTCAGGREAAIETARYVIDAATRDGLHGVGITCTGSAHAAACDAPSRRAGQ
jgi:thymidylate synthase ThyX